MAMKMFDCEFFFPPSPSAPGDFNFSLFEDFC